MRAVGECDTQLAPCPCYWMLQDDRKVHAQTHAGKWMNEQTSCKNIHKQTEDRQFTANASLDYRKLIFLCAHMFKRLQHCIIPVKRWDLIEFNSATSVRSSSSWLFSFQSATHTHYHTHTHNYREPISDVKPSFSWWQDEMTNGCCRFACVSLQRVLFCIQTRSWDWTLKNFCSFNNCMIHLKVT